MAYISKTNDITILKYTRMSDNNSTGTNHAFVMRLVVIHITVQLIPARRGESSLSWPLSFLCQEGVCAATDLVLHLITYWVGNLMHFNMVHRTRVELVLLGWKPSVLTDRRTVHLPSTNCKRTLSRWLYHSLLPVYYLTKTSRSQQAFCFYFRLFQALFINICVHYNVFLTKSQQLSSLGIKNNFNRQKGGPRIFQSRGPVF